MSHTMPLKQGKVKTDAEVEQHMHGRTDPSMELLHKLRLWAHLWNQLAVFKHTWNNIRTPTRPGLQTDGRRENHHLLPWIFLLFYKLKGKPRRRAGQCGGRAGESFTCLKAMVSCLCHTLWNCVLARRLWQVVETRACEPVFPCSNCFFKQLYGSSNTYSKWSHGNLGKSMQQ